jgi:hypothetical protein
LILLQDTVLVLHLAGHFMCICIENDARNHEGKIHYYYLQVSDPFTIHHTHTTHFLKTFASSGTLKLTKNQIAIRKHKLHKKTFMKDDTNFFKENIKSNLTELSKI